MRPKQETFAAASFEKYRKATRREEFLAQMDTVMPWGKLTALIEPVYPQGEGAGRPRGGTGAGAAHSLSATRVQPLRSCG